MSSSYITFLTYLSLMNTFNMNYNQLQNISNHNNLSQEANLIGLESAQHQNQDTKISNNLAQNNDEQNFTPKTKLKLHKNISQTMKRSQSQLTEKISSKRSTKSVLNSNFSLEEQQEPESAETDFSSPVTPSQKHQLSKLKQQQRNSSSQKKNFQSYKINNSQSYQQDNTQRKKSFFEELEEIAFSYMKDTNKNIKLDSQQNSSQSSQTQQTLSTSSNLINIYPTHIQKEQSQQQLDLINEDEEFEQQNNYNFQKQPKKQLTIATTRGKRLTKKEVKNNQKNKQKENKQNLITKNNINYKEQIIGNTNQTINSVNTNFPNQQKPILITQNQNPINLKFQNISKKLNTQTCVFAEDVYLKSISQEGSIKLQKFPCFKESDLQIPTQFSELIQQQYSDDDKCSGDELLEKAVNYMHKQLVASIVEENPSVVIPDKDKTFTIRDIKIDRDSDEDDQEDECQQYSYNSNSNQSFYRSQSNNYHINNNFLSDDEEECI